MVAGTRIVPLRAATGHLPRGGRGASQLCRRLPRVLVPGLVTLMALLCFNLLGSWLRKKYREAY